MRKSEFNGFVEVIGDRPAFVRRVGADLAALSGTGDVGSLGPAAVPGLWHPQPAGIPLLNTGSRSGVAMDDIRLARGLDMI